MPSEKTSKAIETLEKAKSDLSSHCGDLEDKLNYRLSLDLQNLKDSDIEGHIGTDMDKEDSKCNFLIIRRNIHLFSIILGEPYVPGSFARKQISKLYSDKLKFHNSWEDSVSLFYSWLKKEEGSVKDKQIQVGDVAAITKAIKEAEVIP